MSNNPMDCSPPVSSVHGILQARILEWVAVPFSRGSLAIGSKVQTYLFPDSGGVSHHSNMWTQNQGQLSSQTTALQKIRVSLCITSVKSARLQNVKNEAHYLLDLLLPRFPFAGGIDFLLINPSCLKM